ncbi:MAG: prenyltransferase/squalene oxidase repeat-containing protein [Sulfuricellaceae bacterium]
MSLPNTKINDVLISSVQWLVNQQSKDGGWPGLAGRKSSTLNTAEAMIALIDSGKYTGGNEEIKKAVDFLTSHQIVDGKFKGAWSREIPATTNLPDVIRTAFSLEALLKAGVGVNAPPVITGIIWLISIQNKNQDDKAWGFRQGLPDEILPTCLALLALIQAYSFSSRVSNDAKKIRESIDCALKSLKDKFRGDGFDGKLPYFGSSEILKPTHTLYAVLVLQSARRCSITNGEYLELENKALEWLQSQNEFQPIEEHIPIDLDRDNPQWDYDFQHMTDTLLIRVLCGSDHKTFNKDNQVASKAFISLGKRWHQSKGGFFGYWLFTWSTAKAISALSLCEKGLLFPPSPESTLLSQNNIFDYLKLLLSLGEKWPKWKGGGLVTIGIAIGFGIATIINSQFNFNSLNLVVILLVIAPIVLAAYNKRLSKSFLAFIAFSIVVILIISNYISTRTLNMLIQGVVDHFMKN